MSQSVSSPERDLSARIVLTHKDASALTEAAFALPLLYRSLMPSKRRRRCPFTPGVNSAFSMTSTTSNDVAGRVAGTCGIKPWNEDGSGETSSFPRVTLCLG